MPNLCSSGMRNMNSAVIPWQTNIVYWISLKNIGYMRLHFRTCCFVICNKIKGTLVINRLTSYRQSDYIWNGVRKTKLEVQLYGRKLLEMALIKSLTASCVLSAPCFKMAHSMRFSESTPTSI